MSDPKLTAMRDAIQTDPGGRGLAKDPHDNLFTACPDDFEAACRSIAAVQYPAVAIVTGFSVLHADPPCGETDGPLGALFLVRALEPLGIRTRVFTDPDSEMALTWGLGACGFADLRMACRIQSDPELMGTTGPVNNLELETFLPTHLLALERVGPNHESGRCLNMRGVDVTPHTPPADLFFRADARPGSCLATIGIGDGGNEIGMGKIPRETIARNVPNGGRIACRVPTDFLIVAGTSNWGAYALAAGVRYLRRVPHDPTLFDPARERELLEGMVEHGPLVDGTNGRRQATVDGLPFEEYVKPLVRLGEILRG
jgi:hypothetical protein